jgi:HAD superfamily phosphoserine phosphatase-like hydrolase
MSELEIEVLAKPFASHIVNQYRDNLTTNLLNRHVLDECLITSGTLTFLVKEIALILGVKVFFGTDPEIVNGIYTGNLEGNPNFEEEKVVRIKKWLGKRLVDQTIAYSDSVHDLPLLSFAKVPTAINPDKKLRKIALDRGWLIDDSRLAN